MEHEHHHHQANKDDHEGHGSLVTANHREVERVECTDHFKQSLGEAHPSKAQEQQFMANGGEGGEEIKERR